MNRPNIKAIKARADAALEQPCHERHQIIIPCLSCESNIQRSLRTDIPELIAYIEHLEAHVPDEAELLRRASQSQYLREYYNVVCDILEDAASELEELLDKEPTP